MHAQLTLLPFPVRIVVQMCHSFTELLDARSRSVLVNVAADGGGEFGDVEEVGTRSRARDVTDCEEDGVSGGRDRRGGALSYLRERLGPVVAKRGEDKVNRH